MTQITFFPSGAVVCSGTHRPEDLIPAWRNYLGASCPDYLRKECIAWENHQLPDHIYEIAAQELLDALDHELNQLAPEDHYFGTHPADGSLFGFWPMEDN